MPDPRRAPGGRPRPRPDRTRLVGLAELLSSTGGFLSDEDEHAYEAGLHAARLLRQHFPDLYTSLVRDLPVTPASMYATMELFVSCADGVLMHVDLCHSAFRDGCADPIRQFASTLAAKHAEPERDVREYIANDRDLIWDPPPMVYGLDRNPDITEPCRYPLALAVWKLLSQTRFAVVRENRPGAFAEMLRPGPLRNALAGITSLPEETDVEALANDLDHRPPHGVVGLGSTILYVAGMTGNQYADTTHDELMDNYGTYGMDWSDLPMLAAVKEAQEEAMVIGQQFHQLNERFRAKPARIVSLFRHVHRIAAVLQRTAARPKTLMEIYAPHPPKEDPYGHVYHPIDISRDVETDARRGIDILGPVTILSATDPTLWGRDVHHPDGDAPPAPSGRHPPR